MNLILILSSILLAWVGLRLLKPFSPAWMFTLIWTSQLLFAGIVLDNYIKFSYYGLLYILLLNFFFVLGAIILPMKSTNQQTQRNLANKRVKKILIVLLFLALGNPIMAILQNGFDLTSFFSIESWLEMGSEMSESRYAETQNVTFLSQILLIFMYLAALFGGYCYVLCNKRLKFLCIMEFLPSVLVSITQGVKLNLVTSVFLFFIGIVVSSFANGKSIIINYKKLVGISVSSFVFLLILYSAMIFRIGEVNENAISIVNQKVSSYTFGHIPCFDIWFSEKRSDDSSLKLGLRTFYAISNSLGIEKRELGVYQERITFGKDDFEGESNVFTAFRAVVDDFGLYGSLLFMLIIGYISQLLFYDVQRWSKSYFCTTFLCGIYAYVIWSPLTSYFTYLSYIMVLAFFYILLHFTYTNEPARISA